VLCACILKRTISEHADTHTQRQNAAGKPVKLIIIQETVFTVKGLSYPRDCFYCQRTIFHMYLKPADRVFHSYFDYLRSDSFYQDNSRGVNTSNKSNIYIYQTKSSERLSNWPKFRPSVSALSIGLWGQFHRPHHLTEDRPITKKTLNYKSHSQTALCGASSTGDTLWPKIARLQRKHSSHSSQANPASRERSAD